MIQSSRACIRNELAKICGTVACVLSGSCQLDFCVETGTNDIRRSCWKSYEVVCHTCKQGKQNCSYKRLVGAHRCIV